MIKITDFPTDVNNQFPELKKVLISAVGKASLSKDNKELLLATIEVAIKDMEGMHPEEPIKKVVKKAVKKS